MTQNIESMLSLMDQKFDMSFQEISINCNSENSPCNKKRPNNPENQPQSHSNQNHLEESLSLSEPFPQQQVDSQILQREQLYEEGLKRYESACQMSVNNNLKNIETASDKQLQISTTSKDEIQGQSLDHEDATSDEQLDYYRSLNDKFEQALSKLSLKKTSNNIKNVKFIERVEQYQKKRQNDLKMLKTQKQKQQMRKCKGRPLINSHSQQILSHYQPIQDRYKAVIAQKIKNIQIKTAQKKKKQAEEQEQIIRKMQEYKQIIVDKVGTIRTEKQYYESMQAWNQRKQKNIKDLSKKQEEQIKQQTSFKPKINANSNNLMKKKLDRVLIYQKEPELKKIPEDKNCTFKPNLKKTLKK